MRRINLIILVLIGLVGFLLIHSKKRAEAVAWPVMEKCWNNENTKIISLTMRPNFREGFNWRVGAKYTEKSFPNILENPEYGDVPEILVNILNGEVEEKHFQEIDEPQAGCE